MRHENRHLRRFAGLFALVLVGASLSGCASGSSGTVASDCEPAHTFSTVKDGTLTVAGYELPPFTKIEGKTLTGVDADILTEFAERECLTVTLMPTAAAAAIPTVQSGRADVAAGDWYRTEARAEVVALSAPLYVDQMGLISKEGGTSIPDLKGKSIGTVDGYLWVDDLKKYFGSSLKVYSSPVNMYQDINAGRLDVGADSYASAVYTAKDLKVEVAEPFDQVAASVESAQACFPTVKDNPELLEALDAAIAEMHEDGTIAKILEEHGLDASGAETGEARLIS